MNYTRKYITSQVFSLKRCRLKNVEIETEDVHHIPGRDIIELYLKLNGSRNFYWKDINTKSSPRSTLKNVALICTQVFRLPFVLFKTRNQIIRLSKKTPTNFLKNPHHLLYLRTDHWFNLTSGGSVGHVSYVIDELNNALVLKKLESTSTLFNVSFEPCRISSPNYRLSGNIPNLPEINYNLEQIKNFKEDDYKGIDGIYQRYSKGNYFGVWLSLQLNIPLILEYNGSELWVAKNWGNKRVAFDHYLEDIELLNLKHANVIVVVSEPLKHELIRRGVNPEKILVNPNGVNTTIFNPKELNVELKKEIGLTKEHVIGFIGTFGEWHGVLELAKSIIQFFNQHPSRLNNTEFLLIGDGNLKTEVENIINQSPYSSNVIFTGRISQNLAPDYLNQCNILVSPHIGNSDGSEFFGSPTKLFEYMAMQKPIIASALGQIEQVLMHEQNAFLVEPGNVNSLAESYETVLTQPQLAQKMAFQARNDVKSKYTWKKHVEKILKFTENMSNNA